MWAMSVTYSYDCNYDNIFLKNLPQSYDKEKLRKTFEKFGKIAFCEVNIFVLIEHYYFKVKLIKLLQYLNNIN